jgi:hypothetical protein
MKISVLGKAMPAVPQVLLPTTSRRQTGREAGFPRRNPAVYGSVLASLYTVLDWLHLFACFPDDEGRDPAVLPDGIM